MAIIGFRNFLGLGEGEPENVFEKDNGMLAGEAAGEMKLTPVEAPADECSKCPECGCEKCCCDEGKAEAKPEPKKKAKK
jgi:hypothetical protein